MKILMVVAYFLPEIGSASHIYSDLARAFVKRGHEVDIITSYPRNYNLNNSDQLKQFPLDEILEGINIHRVKHPHTRDNFIIRGLEHFLLPQYYFRRYKKMDKKFDVCLFYIPPLPLYYFSKRIKRYDGTPSILNFQDFHPQELTDVGVLKNPFLIKILEHIEKEAYKNADYITVLSKGGIDYIVQRGGNPNKITHIYNGILLSDSEKNVIRCDFKKQENIETKFLVSYAGILSPFQGLDQLVDSAMELQDNNKIVFYIVGDGIAKEHLAQRIEKEKLKNVILIPFQSRENYFNILNSSDVSIISLDKRMNAPCIPGKLVNILAAKKPILATVPLDSETSRLINKVQCGLVVSPNDPHQLSKSILNLETDKSLRETLGNNGRNYLIENMNLDKCVNRYEDIIIKHLKIKYLAAK